jgi:hypothetical protein
VVILAMRMKSVNTNTLTIDAGYPSFSITGTVSLSWTLATASKVAITWTPATNQSQAMIINAGTTSVTISGFLAEVDYTFRISAISNEGSGSGVNCITARALSSPVRYTPIIRDLAISQTTMTSMSTSSTGQYVVLGNANGVFVSNNSGYTFTTKSTTAPFTTNNYTSRISDDGVYVLLYQTLNTTSTYYLSTDGGVTFATKQVLAAGFTLFTIACSSSGQYLFASGSGTNGGIFLSSDYGATFTRKVTSTLAQGLACSPNGRTIVVASNGAAPWISQDYGATFATFGSTTYQGRRVFVHPDETYFAIRCVTPDAFLYTDLSAANGTISSVTAYKNATTQSLITNTPGDVEGFAHIDQNGRYYYVTSSNLYFMDWAFTGRTQVTLGTTLTDARLRGSVDRLVTETNTVTLATPSTDSSGNVTLSWNLSVANRPVYITWSPRTATAQPVLVAADTLSTIIAGFANNTTYQFTVSALNNTTDLQSTGRVQTSFLVSTSVLFSSFPSSLLVRYDLFDSSGRETSTSGVKVTTNGAHIYKILDKSGNNHHMISRGTDSNGANTLVNSGLGLNKPCLSVKYTTYSTMGYSTTSYPLFPNGYELICVIRPTPPSTGTVRQILVNKYKLPSPYAYPFDIKFDRQIGNGTNNASYSQTSGADTTSLDMYTTHATAFVMSTRFFKTASVDNGKAFDRKNGSDIYSTTIANASFYADNTTGVLNLCYRPDAVVSGSYEIGEVLMFNAELTAANRELMEGYLATKWGIAITNPSHTYYNTPVQYSP